MSGSNSKKAKRAVRVLNSGVNAVVFVIIVSLVILSLYSLWDTHQVVQAASNEQYEKYTPTEVSPQVSFEQLQRINPEVVSWLEIYGTGVDYPVAQSLEDNQKYLSTDAFGKEALSGSLYLDFRNSAHFTDFNTIMYGHHMASSMMFGDLAKFADQSFFDSHRYGDLFYDGSHHGVEIFAFAHTDGYNTTVYAPALTDGAARQHYLDYLGSIAQFQRDIGVSIDDHILVMSTCNNESTNGRDILVARIDDQTFVNTLETVTQDSGGIASVIDSLQSIWRMFPQGTLVIGWPLVVLLLLLILFIGDRRQRKKAAAPVPRRAITS